MNKILNRITSWRLLSLIVFLLLNNYAYNQNSPCDCGAAGPCVDNYYSDQSAGEQGANDGGPSLGGSATVVDLTSENLGTDNGQTYQFCYEYTTQASETRIAFKIFLSTPNNCNENRVYQVFPSSNCGSASLTELSSYTDGNGFDWHLFDVSPNTSYNFCVTSTFDATDTDCDANQSGSPAIVNNFEAYMYNASPSTSCSADIGAYNITNATQVGPFEYDLDDGCTINLGLNNLVIPTGGEVRWAVFSQLPTLPLTTAQLNDLYNVPGFIATDGNQSTSASNTGGQSVTPAGFTTLWAVPFTTDNTSTSTQINDGDDCYDIQASAIQINFTSTPCTTPVNSCGDCSTPNCPIGNVSTYADRFPPTGAQTCVTGISVTGTYKTYQTVTSDNLGTLGAYVQTIGKQTGVIVTITQELFPVGNCTSNISAANNNVAGRSQNNGAWNPEWYNLTPNTNYVLVTTFDITGGDMTSYCMDYYHIPNPPDPCAMQNGSVQTCNCEFTDSGGNSSNYGASENNTFTICPDPSQTGAKIQLDFTSFAVEDGYDFMYIYDGNTATGQPIISVSGSNPTELNSTIAATISNTSGCLTVVFTSDFAGQDTGWAADVTCYTPCTTPIADASTTEFGTQQTIRMCPGDQLNFDGSTSTHNATSITTYAWDFDNGTTGSNATETVTFNDPGRYIPYLTVTNDEGCSSTNALPYEVIVSTVPNFNTTTADQTACEGDQVCLTGVINYPTLVDAPTVPPTGTVTLPDGTGVSYETTVLIKGYTSGQTITSASDLQSICVNMEHSALDDITITLIAPSGEEITLHDRGGGASALGVPALDANAYSATLGCDFGGGASGPGTGWDYCFNSSANETFMDHGDANWDNTTNPCYQIPAGDYLPIDPFSGLIGADLNGTWTIRYEDASGNDDGYLFGWDLTFDPSLLPANATISPVIATQAWTGPTTIDSNVDDVICVTPDNTGTNTYTYTVTNDFGCIADTTIDVDVTVLDDATFTLSATCDGGTATVSGTIGGTFSFTSAPTDAAVIDPTTGTVSAGTSGNTYDVTYTTNGTCPTSSSNTVVANSSDDPTFTLNARCDGAVATITGTTGGTFSFTTPPTDAAVIDPTTGIVSGGTSGNTYDITYATSGACAANSTQTVTATNSDDPTFTLTPTCDGATASISGTTGGTFSFTTPPADAAVIDPSTGTVSGGTSGNTYDITYATSGACAANSTQTVTATNSDDPTFTLTPTCDGATAAISGTTGGTFSFTTPPVDAAVIDPSTGTITGGTSGNTYDITYATTGACAASSTQTVTSTTTETPTIGCGTTTLTSVEFTITNTMTGITDYNVSYTINGGTASTSNNVNFPYTVSSLNGGDIVVITVTPNGTGCYQDGTGSCTANNCNSPIITTQPANTSDCEGQAATFTVTETGGDGTYSWEISTDDGANYNPLADGGIYSGTGTATLSISDNTGLNATRYRVVVNEAVGSCPTTSNSGRLIVLPSETPSITCGVAGEDSVEFNWTIPNGATDYDLSYSIMGQTPITISNHNTNRLGVTGLNIGDTVVLTITTNGTGCYLPTTNFCYTSCTPPNASFLPSPSRMNTLKPTTTMINSSSNATNYFWDFGDGETSSLSAPTKTYSDLDTGTYLITLTASNGTCTDIAYYYVKVFEDLVYYIPNTFTPDNNDYNALFTPVFTSGYDTGNYSMLIFNRWGELVFSSSEVNSGWDGKDMRNGKSCEDGTYIWKIEFGVKGIDKRETISGHVNLLR